MAWIWVAAVWIFLLILSIAIYKVVQKLARRSYGRALRIEEELKEPVSVPQTEKALPELPVSEAKPAKKKVVEPVAKEKPIKKPKKGKIVSPAKYPECFGTDYKLEKCKKDCGVVKECIEAVEVLQRM